jgi:hypothetical protein
MTAPCGGHQSSKYEGLFVSIDPFLGKSIELVRSAILVCPANKDLVVPSGSGSGTRNPSGSGVPGSSLSLQSVGHAPFQAGADRTSSKGRAADGRGSGEQGAPSSGSGALVPEPGTQNPGQEPGVPDPTQTGFPSGSGPKMVLKSHLNLQHSILPCGQSHINDYPIGKDVSSLESEHAVPLVPQHQDLLGSEFGDTVKLGGVPWSQTKCSLSDLKSAVDLGLEGLRL